MKKPLVQTALFVIFILAVAAFMWSYAGADDGVRFHWKDDCGYTCYQWPDGSGDCYPCLDCESPDPVPVPDPTPDPDPDPDPTPDPTPEPSPEPEKPKCNRGLGNGPEGCDPGNSGGKPGAAGEDNE